MQKSQNVPRHCSRVISVDQNFVMCHSSVAAYRIYPEDQTRHSLKLYFLTFMPLLSLSERNRDSYRNEFRISNSDFVLKKYRNHCYTGSV